MSTSDILNIIIPFFDKYTIKGIKNLDYIDFKKVAEMVKFKQHLSESGYNQILEIKKGMNLNRI